MAASSLNHGLMDGKEYTLNLGTSFQPKKAQQSYHLMRYDFKPSSIDTSKPAQVQIGSNNECAVTIPGANDSTTTYKGGKKPCTKECVLIIDKNTGEITLERISCNIPLKKSRNINSMSKNKSNTVPKSTPNSSNSSSHTTSITKPVTSNMSMTSQQNTTSPVKQKTLSNPTTANHQSNTHALSQPQPKDQNRGLSTTSTSDSSSSDSSDSDSETEKEMAAHVEDTFATAAYEPPPPAKPSKTGSFSTLQNDLQLSDSSDSD